MSELQALRIAAGWHIRWNSFFEYDFLANNEHLPRELELFFAVHIPNKVAIDLEWQTESQQPPKGYFRLRLLKLTSVASADDVDVDWDRPISEFDSESSSEVVSKMDQWMG